MKRLLAAMAALAALFAAGSAYALGVSVNGEAVRFGASDGAPFIENGRTLVPLRAASEAYGAEVGFDSASNSAVVTKDGVSVTVPIDDSVIYVNGETVTNDVAARIVDSRTYLPIRAVMEAFGAEVGFDAEAQTVTVNDADVLFVQAIENGPEVSQAIVWNKWNDAVTAQEAGDYAAAVAGYREVAPRFMKEGVSNMALLFQRLGECYGAMGEYHNAAVCYERSAHYWDQAPGQEQTALYYAAQARYVDTDIRLYLKNEDKSYKRSKYFGLPGENAHGIILGTTYNSNTASLTGVRHPLELQYFDYGDEFSRHDYFFERVAENDLILELGWQPRAGMASVTDTEYIIRQAKYLESAPCTILLRFANEMNDTTCPWYTTDYNLYIEKYRLVADIFRKYAPSVALVWAPNFYPAETIDLYYPGDEYVDYVGLSTYQEYDPKNDPLGQGIDRSRWSSVLDGVYNTYGKRKPIIVSEGGCSYVSSWTGEDITEFSARQMEDFYTYLPIKYPNLKMVVLFNKEDASGKRKFILSENKTVLDAYIRGIQSSPLYMKYVDYKAPDLFYYELMNNFTAPAALVELCSYVTAPVEKLDYVVYTVDGVDYPAYAIPYSVSVDLSAYVDRSVDVRVQAFAGGTAVSDETFRLNVRASQAH